MHTLLHDKCAELGDDRRYDECRSFYRGKLHQSKALVLAVTQLMANNVNRDVKSRCAAVLSKNDDAGDNADAFLECSSKVSREHINKIGEYVKVLYAANDALRNDVKDFD
mgnify:CR=1 FL=1